MASGSLINLLFQVYWIFTQAWAIPGTIFCNLLAGALFGMYIGNNKVFMQFLNSVLGFPIGMIHNSFGSLLCNFVFSVENFRLNVFNWCCAQVATCFAGRLNAMKTLFENESKDGVKLK